MQVVIYSMQRGKIEFKDAFSARFKGYDIFEVELRDNHRPIIGDINHEFEIEDKNGKVKKFEVVKGFYEFHENKLSVVVQFEE